MWVRKIIIMNTNNFQVKTTDLTIVVKCLSDRDRILLKMRIATAHLPTQIQNLKKKRTITHSVTQTKQTTELGTAERTVLISECKLVTRALH